MSELLLINPRSRRKAARKSTKRRVRRTVAAAPRRRRNPISVSHVKRRVMRRTHVAARRVHHRRRRNPISLGRGSSGMIGMFKEAAIGGIGTVAFDVLMGFVNKYLPASMQRTNTGIGVGDAVKAAITVVVGNALSKHTKGLSRKMAAGSLTVQAAEIARMYLPASMPVAGLGFQVPGRVVQGSARIGPNLNAYGPAGARTPLLSAYTGGGASPLLSGVGGARMREGAVR